MTIFPPFSAQLDNVDLTEHLPNAEEPIVECTLSDGSIPVSSEGLACSDFSSPVSVDEPVRRPLIPSLIKSTTAKARSDSVQAVSSQKSPGFPSLVPPARPEEDILFQWRLRRKMEQAREWSQSQQHSSLHGSTFSWQGPSLCYPSANGQAYKSSHASEQQRISQRLDDSLPKVVPKKTPNPGKSKDTSADEPICKHIPSPPPASSGAIQAEWPSHHHKKTERNKKEKTPTKDLEKNEKKTAVAIRKQKKLSRCIVDSEHADGPSSTNRSSSHQRVSKKVMSWAEQHQQEFPSESCTGDHAPPPSPIHSALGQVVSEVLFPTVDSSPAQRTPVSLVSPLCAASSAPPQSSIPPCNAYNSMEVISQLLQEAEDSDEKEFEDDPLLQVLRKQRKWVKEQIR
eukprot:superscaffoldBa00002133_g13304